MERRVVITGLGVVSPVGNGKEEFWNNLLAGKPGVGPITQFDATDFPVKIAGEVKDFDPVALAGDRKTVRHMDRYTQFAVAAAKMAVADAKLDMTKENPDMALVEECPVYGAIFVYHKKSGTYRIRPLQNQNGFTMV